MIVFLILGLGWIGMEMLLGRCLNCDLDGVNGVCEFDAFYGFACDDWCLTGP